MSIWGAIFCCVAIPIAVLTLGSVVRIPIVVINVWLETYGIKKQILICVGFVIGFLIFMFLFTW
jgi:hypothetical protein